MTRAPVKTTIDAEIRRTDVTHQADDQPPHAAKPTLRWRHEQGEDHQVGPPVPTVDPQQAFEQDPDRIGGQVVQVRGLLLQQRMKSPDWDGVLDVISSATSQE